MDEKKLIADEAKRIGIDIIGFASSEPFFDAERILKERKSKGYLSGFEEEDIHKRVHPELLLEGCRSIISAGISYNIQKFASGPKKSDKFRCSISMSSWGEDYHRVLSEKLAALSHFMQEKFKCRTEYFVDTGPLSDREAAKRAGLGFTGKNSFIINSKLGSLIFLGEILTDLHIEPDAVIEEGCGGCDLCIKACPTGALCGPYTLNAKKCLSYITQSRNVEFEDFKKIGKNIYGCDICQKVCPFNKTASESTHREFVPEEWNFNPDASDILDMDNKSFNNTFKRTSSGWRGKKTLQRNALIALSNSSDRAGAAEIIKRSLKDTRPDIRKTAILALYNLLGSDSFGILEEVFKVEEDNEIKGIIKKIINN